MTNDCRLTLASVNLRSNSSAPSFPLVTSKAVPQHRPFHSLHQPQAQKPSSSPQCQFKVVWFPTGHLSSKAEFFCPLTRILFLSTCPLSRFPSPDSELWALIDQHGLHPSSVGQDTQIRAMQNQVFHRRPRQVQKPSMRTQMLNAQVILPNLFSTVAIVFMNKT